MSNTDFSVVDKLVDAAIRKGLLTLGKEIKKRAIILAPVDSGRLRRSGKVEVTTVGDAVEVSFNTPYARRRHYENNLHPSTRLYLNNALKSISDPSVHFKEEF